MATPHPRRTAPPPVTVIGHSGPVVATVGFFVGAGTAVRVFTADAEVERLLAPYPGVEVARIGADYAERPADLPPPPYLVAVDRIDEAQRIRAWLPPCRSLFWFGGGRGLPEGYLTLMPAQARLRDEVARRLENLKRVDALLDCARGRARPLVLMYGDPDPDAIAAALGVAALWRTLGVVPVLRHTGEVTRYQNRLLINWLRTPIERLGEDELAQADAVAVVDAQPGFWREHPPRADAVIDHHPPREDTAARFIDVRTGYGATSTKVAEYLLDAEVPIDRRLATALIYGIITDTNDLRRGAGAADIRAYERLHDRADHNFISRLEKSQVPMVMLDFISWGIDHRVTWRDLVLVHFGAVPSPDVLVQTADLLLLTCGISWVVCAGVARSRERGDRLVVVFRGDGHQVDVGKRATLAFAKLGSAGGHRTMARAEIPLAGGAIDATCALLVENLFRRLAPARQNRLIRRLKSHLASPRPSNPDEFEFGV